ncbi:MAG: hypothetical protein ACRDFS_04270 [Chloroflexota bacterium]
MVSNVDAAGRAPAQPVGALPPVTELGVASLALIVAAGIYASAYLPQHAPLAPAVGLLAASAVLLIFNIVRLRQAPVFAWKRFYQVARWALLVYLISAGMLELIFLLDGLRGNLLLLISLMLVVYAVDIPLILAFTVARFQQPER